MRASRSSWTAENLEFAIVCVGWQVQRYEEHAERANRATRPTAGRLRVVREGY